VVGADEVGSNAGDLEKNLPRIFTLASSWNAVVLLDEAEVFLELSMNEPNRDSGAYS
jgi:hypothetical protein